MEAVLAGAAAYKHEVNRSTRAYVVLFEESDDGRRRARFIEHQMWTDAAGGNPTVRSAGVFISDGEVARVPLVAAPAPPHTISPWSSPDAAGGPAA